MWGDNVLLVGDFNSVANVQLDRHGGKDGYGSGANDVLQDLCARNDLTDVWRSQVSGPGYTHHTRHTQARLDRIYISGSRLAAVGKTYVTPCTRSDHWFLTLQLRRLSEDLKPSVWKFNEELLGNRAWCAEVRALLQTAPCNDSLPYWWDQTKEAIASLSQLYGRRAAVQYRRREQQLEDALLLLLNKPGKTSEEHDEFLRLQAELDSLQERKMIGAAVRGRIQWMRNQERPSRTFYSFERSRRQQNAIRRLRYRGTECSRPSDLQDAVFSHFRALFADPDPPTFAVPGGLFDAFPRLSDADASCLNVEPSLLELDSTLQSMQNGKAPGPDGLTKAFYVAFWPQLRTILLRCFLLTFKTGLLGPSQRAGLIVLLPKTTDSERQLDLQQWRPITLLNFDYKLYAKLLANRLRRVLPSLIGAQQTCAVPGRSIHDIQMYYNAVLDWAKTTKKGALLLSIDLNKAFDCVRHPYLFRVLESAGISGEFLRAVRACYTRIVSKVSVNGCPTDEFPVQRSVRQGCPLSPFLFILQLEPILRAIQRDPDVYGVPLLPDVAPVAYGAYADDVVFTLTSKDSVKVVLRVFRDVARSTGMAINYQKSTGLWLGKFKPGPSEWMGFHWRSDGLKLLGVWAGDAFCRSKNFEDLYPTVERLCASFNTRRLTLRGRIMLWNVYCLSRFWYRFRASPVPISILRKLDRLGALFVWRSKYEPTSRSLLIYPREDGGLGMFSMLYRVQACRMLQLRDVLTKDVLWCRFYATYLSQQVVGSGCLSVAAASPCPGSFLQHLLRRATSLQDLQSVCDMRDWNLRIVSRHLILSNVAVPRLLSLHGGRAMRTFVQFVFRLHLLPAIRNVLFKFALGLLPTASWLLEKGALPHHVSSQCQVCHCEEDADHVLFRCTEARRVWSYIGCAAFPPPQSDVDWVIGLPQWPVDRLAVFGCASLALWELRNIQRFGGPPTFVCSVDRYQRLRYYHSCLDC